MRIYFSGGSGLKETPEALIPQRKPHVMLSYHQIRRNEAGARERLEAYRKMSPMSKEICYGSMFIDSGAFTLFNQHVKHGEPGRWGEGDYSHFDLRRGTPFREYCDDYAAFIKHIKIIEQETGRKVICANVDAISNPAKTWEIQRFFEEQHGVQPVPVVHFRTPPEYVDRYVEAGKYTLLGVGGLGQGVSPHEYRYWGNRFFAHICSKRRPLIRTHGFAMTSWQLLCRWPWWSVDSASWVRGLSAYGWLYVPPWDREKGCFRFDREYRRINVSPRSQDKLRYFKNVTEIEQEIARKWLKHLRLEMGSVDAQGKMTEFGVSSHHRARNMANLHYFKDLEESRPRWPHPF